MLLEILRTVHVAGGTCCTSRRRIISVGHSPGKAFLRVSLGQAIILLRLQDARLSLGTEGFWSSATVKLADLNVCCFIWVS